MLSIESGGSRMSRRRSKNPTKAISITLPQGLLFELEERLPITASRSAFIAAAIRAKLEGEGGFTVAEASDKQLLAALFTRGVISKEAYNLYTERFKLD